MNTLIEIGPKEGELFSWRKPLLVHVAKAGSNISFRIICYLTRFFGLKMRLARRYNLERQRTGRLWVLHIELALAYPLLTLNMELPVGYARREASEYEH